MNRYDHKKIEGKWQKYWEAEGVNTTRIIKGKPKCYVLDMFPYPSGEGLHVGHPKGYIATDIYARYKKMAGFNVLHPMGWDAFGLPAENYAIKNKVHPQIAVRKNIARYKKQLGLIGLNYDWDREINTADPKYYKWTQWIFLQMYKHGLAYESNEPINWCPSCKTGLANEDLEDGRCERCGSEIEKKPIRQWMLRIKNFADRLIEGLDTLDWPQSIKESQRNWIGKSAGSELSFKLDGLDEKIKIFTTRADTIFGCTYLVLSPQHPLITKIAGRIKNIDDVRKYVDKCLKNNANHGLAFKKEKTGIILDGISAVNPASKKSIPIYIADYVLSSYGTGAIMAVPAHDERDFEFARLYKLPVKEVIIPTSDGAAKNEVDHAYIGEGFLINSGVFNGMDTDKARYKITRFLDGNLKTSYKLQDWVFSRQRYWGEPIPLVHCEKCASARQNVLLIHGFEGHGDNNWFPWLKEKLEKENLNVFCPTLPDPKHPDLNKWLASLEPIIKDFGENDIIVGHSLGSKAALHLLEKSNKKIGHLYLIASAIGVRKERDWDTFKKSWPKSDVESLKIFWDHPVRYEKVRKSVPHVVLVLSDNDPIVSLETHRSLPKDWQYFQFNGRKHFQEKEIPELFDLIIQAKNNGIIPVPEDELPVLLPKVKSYEPTGTGESPLAKIDRWVNISCPKCGGKAKRETNTMPQWAGSCWYYLRYADPNNRKLLINSDAQKYWLPVDYYVGGAEHATRHLIYSRFWHKFLFDIDVVSQAEPFIRLQHVGLVLGADGRKMSKRFGNIVNPDDVIKEYGADTLRIYEMFMGPFENSSSWSVESIIGSRRLREKIWRLHSKLSDKSKDGKKENNRVDSLIHTTIKKVSADIESFKFNTAISSLMILVNNIDELDYINKTDYEKMLLTLAPLAPHMTDEMWRLLGHNKSIHLENWPKYDPNLTRESTTKIIVQINGKLRGEFEIPYNLAEESVKKEALDKDFVKKWLSGKSIIKIIYIKNRLINIVVD